MAGHLQPSRHSCNRSRFALPACVKALAINMITGKPLNVSQNPHRGLRKLNRGLRKPRCSLQRLNRGPVFTSGHYGFYIRTPEVLRWQERRNGGRTPATIGNLTFNRLGNGDRSERGFGEKQVLTKFRGKRKHSYRQL